MERKINAAQKDGGLSRDAAIEEVVADACEMVMGNSKAIERLAKEKPGLAKRIADWLHEFFSDIRKSFEGVEARHEEAKAMLDYMDELAKLWDDALVEAAENRGGTQKGSSTKFSYAGRKSKSADHSLLKTAEEMEKQGKSSEQIRKETGWFRGMDGEWRYDSMTRYSLRDRAIPTRSELEAKKDIPVVDIRSKTNETYREQRKTFLESDEAKEIYSNPVLNRDTNEPLFIIPASFTHTFSNKGQENILLVKHIREIVENAVLTHGEQSRKTPDDHTTGVYKFFGAVQTSNGVQPVKLTVKEYKVEGQDIPRSILDYTTKVPLGDTYASVYDGKVLVLEEIEKETSSSAASSTQEDPEPDNHPSVSMISVKDLLDLVKGEDVKYIPQRETNESRNSNNKFSRRDSAEGLTKEEARAQAAAYTRLKAENAELRRRVEYWKGQTRRTKKATVRQADVNRFARQLIKRYGSTADQATIRQALQEMGNYLVQNNGEALDFACRSKLRNKVIDTKP